MNDNSMMDEQGLIDRAKSGDEGAFESLVTAHKDRVYRVCLALLKDPVAADETAQDVFVRLFEQIQKFRGESRLSTWLYRVAVNACSDRRRWWIRWMARMDVPAAEPSSPDLPDRRLELREDQIRVLDALNRLSSAFREILVLRELEERDYSEIAEILGLSMGTVESRLFRARKKLRAILESDNEGETMEIKRI